MLSERDALVGLNMVYGLGCRRIHGLLKEFSSPCRIWSLPYKDLCKINYLGTAPAQALDDFRSSGALEQELKKICSSQISIVTILDEEYPFLLRQISDPPVLLYVKGRLPDMTNGALAVVGSRRASFYGLEYAQKLSYQLAAMGIVIISGFARGIDTSAHRGAVRAGYPTVAVLGSGLDRIYPPQNNALADEIIKNGAIVSEFPLDTDPFPYNFPRRNRIVAGLSLGVVVVEASNRSGALITASLAADEGREVFAVPGQVSSPVSAGCNALIKDGAVMVTGINDIIEELGYEVTDVSGGSGETGLVSVDLTDCELKAYNVLGSTSSGIDDILIKSGLKIGELMSSLVSLQTKRLVKELPGKKFVRNII